MPERRQNPNVGILPDKFRLRSGSASKTFKMLESGPAGQRKWHHDCGGALHLNAFMLACLELGAHEQVINSNVR